MKKSAAVSAAIAEIDQKIETLQAARQVLMSMNGAVEVKTAAPKKNSGWGGARNLSAAARKKIAAAQKKRWADYHRLKKAAAKKTQSRPGRSPAKVLTAAG